MYFDPTLTHSITINFLTLKSVSLQPHLKTNHYDFNHHTNH